MFQFPSAQHSFPLFVVTLSAQDTKIFFVDLFTVDAVIHLFVLGNDVCNPAFVDNPTIFPSDTLQIDKLKSK